MADDVSGTGEPMSNGADTAPVAGVISQYIKDFSFENPNAPAIYQQAGAPKIDVGFTSAPRRSVRMSTR